MLFAAFFGAEWDGGIFRETKSGEQFPFCFKGFRNTWVSDAATVWVCLLGEHSQFVRRPRFYWVRNHFLTHNSLICSQQQAQAPNAGEKAPQSPLVAQETEARR